MTTKPSPGPDVDELIRFLERGFRKSERFIPLNKGDIESVCQMAREDFLFGDMCLNVYAPMNVVGDLHGQYEDLLRIIRHNGAPPKQRYLFLGDYVDRGLNSVETMMLLLCYKLKYSQCVYLLRGNHESQSINRVYGFYDECKRRYSTKLWRCFVDCYNCMPVAALISNRIFCCHGGLSPNLVSIEEINKIKRPTEIPESGVLCDLLWSDPERTLLGWGRSQRGVSYVFGSDVVDHFISHHKLDLICRAHQVVEDGYEFFAKRQLVTIFSAPNYCGVFDNAGAVMSISDNLVITFAIFNPKGAYVVGLKNQAKAWGKVLSRVFHTNRNNSTTSATSV
ncbi:serine/threonine-protein phosphatase PP1-like [Drosophila busckii]|uniref:serine/threonine-protein phosphatase PP1-like n=1 Tax=Drosophila busckii TaxID=30019 RepID=UPI00083EDD16|nr:serine/threonine-protein phosphatase PP1-like [Drosophila busckii]